MPPTPEDIAAAKAAEDKKAPDEKAAADKAAADKAAADKKAAEEAAKKGSGGGSDGDLDLSGGAGDDKAGGKGPAAGADLKLVIPDDLKDSVPGDWLQKTLKTAKEEKVGQQALDKLAAVFFESARAAIGGTDEEIQAAVQERSREWRREVIADANLGGSIEKAKQSVQIALRGARAAGGEAFAKQLDDYLHGRAPEPISAPSLVRAFHLVGMAQLEDRLGDEPLKPGGKDAGLSQQERQDRKKYPSHYKDQAGAKH